MTVIVVNDLRNFHGETIALADSGSIQSGPYAYGPDRTYGPETTTFSVPKITFRVISHVGPSRFLLGYISSQGFCG